jgi:hypothetical protein
MQKLLITNYLCKQYLFEKYKNLINYTEDYQKHKYNLKSRY